MKHLDRNYIAQIIHDVIENDDDSGGGAYLRAADAILGIIKPLLGDVEVCTHRDLRTARKAMGLTQMELAELLRLSAKNGDRSIRVWETEGNTVPGPVQVAVEFLLRAIPND